MAKQRSTPTVADVLKAVHAIAPPHLAESWDNVGLQVGDARKDAGRILVGLEVTREVLEEARKLKAGTIVTHHPLIFQPLKSLAETGSIPSLASQLIRQGHALIAAHTNLDSVAHGTNGELADRLGLQAAGRTFLQPSRPASSQVKYVVFVPVTHVSAVIDAVGSVGAGVIGNYTHCTFRAAGTGTYRPGEGANPYAGKVGKFEEAEEVRLECVCPKGKLPALFAAVRNVHPYEEIAFDVYPLETAEKPTTGLGLVGALKKPMKLSELVAVAKKVLGIKSVGVVGDLKRNIERVAICTGAGGSFVRSWSDGTADLFVTGEMTHHDCAEAHHRGLPVMLVGHWASEAIVSRRFADQISQELKGAGFGAVDVVVSKAERNPLQRV